MAEPDAAVRFGLPVVRVLLDLAAVATVGLNLLPILVGFDRPKHAEPVLRRRTRGGRGARWSGHSPRCWRWCCRPPRSGRAPRCHRPRWSTYVAKSAPARRWCSSLAVALVAFVLGIASVRVGEAVPAELRTAVALFGLLPLPVTGHATNLEWRDFTMISLELHVLAAVSWTGGLGAMVVLLAANRTLLATALPRFSRLATVCLGVVAATGLFNAVHGTRPGTATCSTTLFGTGYGVLVLLKLTCLSCSPRSAGTSAGG